MLETTQKFTLFFQSFVDIFLGLPWHAYYLVSKYFLIILTIFFFIAWLVILPRAWEFRPQFTYQFRSRGKKDLPALSVAAEWGALMQKAEEAPPHSLTLAVIEADRLVDLVLQRMGLGGEHTADRLSHLDSDDVQSLDNLWRAHHARNEIVHNPEFDLDPRDARRYLGYFEDFLKEVKAV